MKKGIKLRFVTRKALREFVSANGLGRGRSRAYKDSGDMPWVLIF